MLGANIASFVRQNKTETTDLGKEDVAISVIQLIGIGMVRSVSVLLANYNVTRNCCGPIFFGMSF